MRRDGVQDSETVAQVGGAQPSQCGVEEQSDTSPSENMERRGLPI